MGRTGITGTQLSQTNRTQFDYKRGSALFLPKNWCKQLYSKPKSERRSSNPTKPL